MKYLLLNADAYISIIAMVLAFLIGVFVTRWIFGIHKIVNHLENQTTNIRALRRIVGVLAEKQGVSTQELNAIIDECDAISKKM